MGSTVRHARVKPCGILDFFFFSSAKPSYRGSNRILQHPETLKRVAAISNRLENHVRWRSQACCQGLKMPVGMRLRSHRTQISGSPALACQLTLWAPERLQTATDLPTERSRKSAARETAMSMPVLGSLVMRTPILRTDAFSLPPLTFHCIWSGVRLSNSRCDD